MRFVTQYCGSALPTVDISTAIFDRAPDSFVNQEGVAVPPSCVLILGSFTRAQRIGAYLQGNGLKKLHLGASNSVLRGWLNSDLFPTREGVIYLDVTRRFPFANNTFDYVFSKHLIEHIDYDDASAMLRECYRVLKPGGRVRIATINLRQSLLKA